LGECNDSVLLKSGYQVLYPTTLASQGMDRDLLVLSVFEIACSLVFTRGGGTRVEQLPAMLRRYFEPELLEVGWSLEGLSATLFNPA